MFKAKPLLLSLGLLSSALVISIFYGNCANKAAFEVNSEVMERELTFQLMTDDTIVHPEVKTTETLYEPLVADRLLASNILKRTFGPAANDIIDAQVQRQAAYFGGGCSIYSDYAKSQVRNADGTRIAAAADVNAGCVQGVSSNYNMNAGSNVSRQGWMIATCNTLVNNDSLFLNAMKKVEATSSDSYLPDLSNDNIELVVRLFYLEKPEIPVSLIESLKIIAGTQDFKDQAWKSVLYTVCTSSHWMEL